MSKCKKGRNRKCSRKKRKKSYKRNYVTRTTCCKGGCVPSTQDALASTTFPGCGGGTFTRDGRGNLMGCGTTTLSAPNCGVGVPTCGVGVPTHGVGVPTCGVGACGVGVPTCGVGACDPASFSAFTSGAYAGSTEAHLHVDRCGHVYGHSHCGGDIAHSHDSGCQDHYVGRVSDLRTLTRDPDSLDADVLGSSSTRVCGTDRHCAVGENCAAGTCVQVGDCSGVRNAPRPTNLGCSTTSRACGLGSGAGCTTSRTTTDLSSCGNLGMVRPCNGVSLGGFRDPAGCGSVNCSSCRFTSASLCDGSTLSHCNLACAAPGNANTLPASYLNTRQTAPDLRGVNNHGLSCTTKSLCGSKRPTICKSKIKEVYCC